MPCDIGEKMKGEEFKSRLTSIQILVLPLTSYLVFNLYFFEDVNINFFKIMFY